MNQPLRLSVTMLDTYVYGMANEDMSSEALAYELFGHKKPSMAMRMGNAFHRMLENHPLDMPLLENGFSAYATNQKYQFVLPNHLNGVIELGILREQKYEWRIFNDLTLVGKIDAETPSKLIDHKLTYQFDPERYMDSMQWRAYLAMRNKSHFTYQVFEHTGLPQFNPEATQSLGLPLPVIIKNYHRLDQYAYAGMQDDIKAVAHDLATFARQWIPVVQAQIYAQSMQA